MPYKTFTDLHKAYGFDGPEKTREDLTEEEERAFVEDCFDTYELTGFSETFHSPYGSMRKYNGMGFTVVERVGESPEDESGADLSCLPIWRIRLENGEATHALPEEICIAEERKTPKTASQNPIVDTVINAIKNQFQASLGPDTDFRTIYPPNLLTPNAAMSCTLHALAALCDNNRLGETPQEEIEAFINLASLISMEICTQDEPRFTLYDYLDAILNSKGAVSWDQAALKIASQGETEFAKLVALAEQKQKAYSQDAL